MRRLSLVLGLAILLSLFGCGGGSSSKPAVGVSITPSSALTIVQGQQKNFSVMVSNDSINRGVTWSLSGTGCTGTGCGSLTNSTATSVTYNAPASVSSNLTVSVVATSVADATKSASVTITVVPTPSITTTSLPDGVQNAAYTATTLAATGGITPYKWSITTGALPAGLTLNSSTGVISGTPTAAATSDFTVQVADSSSPALTATKALSIVVNPPPPLSVTTASLPSGSQGTAYAATLTATGGTPPYAAWTVIAGALPAGLTLHSATGVIDGTPTAAGTADFTVRVSDSTTPALTATKALSIVIAPPPLTITTTSLPGGTMNSAYPATTLQSSGGTPPVSWSVTAGTLPAGLTLHGTTGVIDGTPTASGTANFTIAATDSSTTPQTKTKDLSIVINPALSVTTTALPDGAMNTAYTATLTSAGGTPTVIWSVGSGTLPDGLTLNGATGVISGTPTKAGKVTFSITATDHSTPPQSSEVSLSITIAAVPLAITTTSLPGATVNSAYNATLNATGGTPAITWNITTGSLPSGLILHGNTGVIDGAPTASGTFNFTVTATDTGSPVQTKTQDLSLVVTPAFTIITTSLPDGTQNTVYPATTLQVTGGTPPITWAVSSGALPTGLTLNSSTGVISGTPTGAGTSNFSLRATDHSTPPQTPEVAFSITVAAAPLAITTTSLPNGTIDSPYGATLQVTGGTPPVSWSVTAGALPLWATLDSSTGAISGTPTGSPATISFTVTVTDSGSPVQSKTQALSITTVTGGVNNAELNGHYAFTLRGFDSIGGGLVTMAGSFAADGNGAVTGGVVDINSTSANHINLAVTGGFYSVGADQRGTMTITTSQGNTTFAFSLGQISSGVAAFGHIIESDSKVLTGTFKKQDTSAFSTASITGSFAFGIGGMESAGRFAAAGVMIASGAGTFSISADTNDAGLMNQGSPNPATMGGTYTITDAVNGRGALIDTTNGSHMAIYVVSASEVFLINTDPFTVGGPPIFTGSAQKQTLTTFGVTSMNGTSVFMSESASSYAGGVPSAAYVGAGLFTFNGSGTITSAMVDENDGGAITQISGMAGTYTVASNGRMTMEMGGNTVPEVFYLVSPGKAFSVGTGGAVAEGSLKRQDAGPFSNGSITGNFIYGAEPPVMNTSGVDIGVVTADGVGGIVGTSDHNDGLTAATESFTDNYTVSSNGRVALSNSIMYIISTSKAVMIEVESGKTNPKIHTVDK